MKFTDCMKNFLQYKLRCSTRQAANNTSFSLISKIKLRVYDNLAMGSRGIRVVVHSGLLFFTNR